MSTDRPTSGGKNPRDPGWRETGKFRASRIPLDYYKSTDDLGRVRNGLLILAVGGTILWLGMGLRAGGGSAETWLGELGKQRATHGELAAVHATWEGECQACHIPYQPIRPESVASGWLGSAAEVTTEKCQVCHLGPPHHHNQLAADEIACTACHRDHRGKGFDLTAVSDAMCASCHEDLQTHRRATATADIARPTGWDRIAEFSETGHPQFADVATPVDPGNIKFNHALHMSAGMGVQDGRPYFRYQDVEPEFRDWYLSADPAPTADLAAAVQLNCAACHETQQTESRRSDGNGESPAAYGSDGRYFLPIRFERHCRACHDIDLSLPIQTAGHSMGVPIGDFTRKEMAAAAIAEDAQLDRQSSRDQAGESAERLPIEVPHGIQPARLDAFLTDLLTSRYVNRNPELLDVERSRRPRVPGRAFAEDEDDLRSAREAISQQRSLLRRLLYSGEQTCAKCHVYRGPAGEEIVNAAILSELIQQDSLEALQIARADIPDVWFEKAVFDHSAHRSLRCVECHAGTRPESNGQSLESLKNRWTHDTVMLPGIDNCTACHSERRAGGKGITLGGARHDCTECHVYHGADHGRDSGGRFESTGTFQSTYDLLIGKPSGGSGRQQP